VPSSREEESIVRNIEVKHSKSSTAIDPDLLRKIVREEIQNSFNHWFKDRLEKKLKEVIDEIEKD
jgi:hypothetical protein